MSIELVFNIPTSLMPETPETISVKESWLDGDSYPLLPILELVQRQIYIIDS